MFGQIFNAIGGAFGDVLGGAAKTTSQIVQAGGATSPAKLAVNYAIGAASSEASVSNVAETALKGQETVQGSIVGAGTAIKDGAEAVANTVIGGVDTIKKYLPVVALGGLGLLLLSRKR